MEGDSIDINAKCNYYGNTPLRWAAYHGHETSMNYRLVLLTRIKDQDGDLLELGWRKMRNRMLLLFSKLSMYITLLLIVILAS